MRILFITPRLPYPPNRGDKIRPWHFAHSLARTHQLALLSLIQTEEETRYADDLAQVFDQVGMVLLKPWQSYRNMLFNVFSRVPLQVHYFHSREMQKRVEQFLQQEEIDVIYAFHLRTAPYIAAQNRAYRILDLTDAVSMFLQRRADYAPWYLNLILRRERVCAQRYEQEIVRRFDEAWLISTIDRDAIWGQKYPDNVTIVPNGIDTTYFKPQLPKPQTRNILFVGYMGAESVDAVTYFYREMFPTVRQHVPDARFVIVGANPPPQIRKLEQDQNVVVTGFVEDLRPYYNEAAVAIAPMRFVAGMQNKILEAMAMEVPVVATTGANEGIDAQDGEEIFVTDTPADFANKVVWSLENWELARKMGGRAREFVKDRFTWDVAAHRVEEIGRIISER